MAITLDLSISETMRLYPQTIGVFKKWRMECPACVGADTESIESGALMHGLDPEEILAALNRAVEENPR